MYINDKNIYVCKFPQLNITKNYNKLEDFEWTSIQIIDYNSYSKIIAKMIV